MLTLGIDCSTLVASVGVARGRHVLAEESRPVSGSHAGHILEIVEHTLGLCGERLERVELVAASLGPGSFTGLRIALSTAKGLAMVTGAPLVGVSTLEAVATAAERREGLVCPVLDARKGEVYAAVFRAFAGGVTRLGEDRVMAPQALAAALDGPCTLVGDGVDAYRDVWHQVLPHAEMVSFDRVSPRGGVVARLGQDHLERFGPGDLRRLEPRYCRKSEAETRRGL